MIGISIKAGFTCPDCDSYVPMNAYVERLRCAACGTDHYLTVDHWKTVLDDAIKEVPHLEEGVGSSSTVFGNLNYRIEYGRLKPRYRGSKDEIPIESIQDISGDGYLTNPQSGEKTFIRKPPDLYNDEFFGIVALIGEEASLIPDRGEGSEVQLESSSDPIALQCPNCGGSLLVDGDTRTETCRFCDSEVHLPDGLWKILHPVRKALRWFLLVDYSAMPFSWESEVYGGVAAGDDGVCLVVYNDYGDMPIISCLRKDRTQLWMRDDLKLECRSGGTVPGPMIDYKGNVLIMHENEMDLYSISLSDGSVTNVIKGIMGNADIEDDSADLFTMNDIDGITCIPDGSILQLKSRNGYRGYYREFVRFDLMGNPLPLWKPDKKVKAKKPGFLARLFKRYSRTISVRKIPNFENIPDRPVRISDSDIDLISGLDGSLYLLHNKRLAALDSTGKLRYSIEIPCYLTCGRPVANGIGEAFLLVELEDDRYQIQRISAQGEVSVYAASIKDGGSVVDCSTIILTSDGKIHTFGYDGVWITIDVSDSIDS